MISETSQAYTYSISLPLVVGRLALNQLTQMQFSDLQTCFFMSCRAARVTAEGHCECKMCDSGPTVASWETASNPAGHTTSTPITSVRLLPLSRSVFHLLLSYSFLLSASLSPSVIKDSLSLIIAERCVCAHVESRCSDRYFPLIIFSH